MASALGTTQLSLAALGNVAGGDVPHSSLKSGCISALSPAIPVAGAGTVSFKERRTPNNVQSSFLGASLLRNSPLRQSHTRSLNEGARAAASSPSSGEGDKNKLAPLDPESSTGLFLTQLLQSHPHLFSAAAEQQLERLVAEKDDQEAKERELSSSGSDLVLYKRIADVRAMERQRALEEVIYALIVAKFTEARVSLLPKMPFLSADELSPQAFMSSLGPVKEKELLSVHSEDVTEMVKEHLNMILGGVRPEGVSPTLDDRILIVTSKVRLGQVYAASITYGYFLRRVDQRFQLEKTMKSLGAEGGLWEAFEPAVSTEEADTLSKVNEIDPMDRPEDNGLAAAFSAAASAMANSGIKGAAAAAKQTPLRQYVMKFDQETLRNTATMRSKEGLNVIGKHTEALFGKPEIELSSDGGLAMVRDDSVRLSLSTLRRMVLEAAAFGSFLWDVESYVDSKYSMTTQ